MLFTSLHYLLTLLEWLLAGFKYLILANVLLSWVNPDPRNKIVRFIHKYTDPALNWVRRFMPDTGALDLSPLALFAIIYLVEIVIISSAKSYLMIYAGRAL